MTGETRPTPAWAFGLGLGAAVVVPASALLAWTRSQATPAIPTPVIPRFVEPGLLIAHLTLAIPLGGLIAARLPRLAAGVCAGLGALAIAAVLMWARADLPSPAGAGLLAGGGGRSALAMILVVPWLVPLAGPIRGLGRPPSGLTAIAALILAVLPPLAMAHRVARSRALDFTAYRETGRLRRAWTALDALRELGVGEVAGAGPIDAVRRSLAGDLRRLARVARITPGPDASIPDRLTHAFALIGLGRVPEAEAEIRAPAATDPDAALLLASIERDRDRWADAERGYLRVIAADQGRAGYDPAALDRCAMAFDGLADARFGDDRAAAAAEALREAITRLPSRAGHFTLRLGRYELEAGRPRRALALIDQARRIDPALNWEAAPLIRSIRVRTPACLLAR